MSLSGLRSSLQGSNPSPQAMPWLVTFTDLVCLMLTFFVMLYAMSEPDSEKINGLARGVPGIAPVRQEGQETPGSPFAAVTTTRVGATDIGYLGNVVTKFLRDDPALRDVTITRRDDDIVLALPADLLFAPGSSEMVQTGRDALARLGLFFSSIDNAIEVVGYTDPTPISGRYKSNWELSLARSHNVRKAMLEAGYRRPMTIKGMGDGQFADVATGRSEAERMRLARRVDLIIRDHRSGQ